MCHMHAAGMSACYRRVCDRCFSRDSVAGPQRWIAFFRPCCYRHHGVRRGGTSAAVPIAATTALRGIRDVGEMTAGQLVLVNDAGGGVREITGKHYDVAALVIPGDDPELADATLAALLIAAGRWRLAPGLGRCRGQRFRPAGRLTSSPRSSTATSTGTTRNCPCNHDGLPTHPAAAEKDCARRIHEC